MEKIKLKRILTSLVSDFKNNEAWKNSEESIQSQYTLDLLSKLGWEKKNIIINQGQEVKTGKKPDIILKDNNNYTIIVIESKEAKKKDKLDGRYQSKTFQEQLVGYCEAEGIYWGILTNFIEWRVYNTHQNILYNNKKYAFHDLLWKDAKKDEYVDLLSDEGIEFLLKLEKSNIVTIRGRWDENTVFYPTQEEIKDDFFSKIRTWRSKIRTDINTNYKSKYSIDDIDLITQKLIDRLIFIDYCSDNHIIPQDILHAILYTKGNIYTELKRIFIEMNDKFNSELFSHNQCDDINFKNEILEPIIKDLTAIDFTRLSVHIIGEVYENYLAELLKQNKISITNKEDEGKIKKKKHGIYYTPENIVDYISSKTIDTLLSKCKTEKEIEKVRVLDPACGSGSFLIKAFDVFLKHYKRVNNEGTLFEFDTRKKILKNNIFGVDLDYRAVEITKLNLMIKALENVSWQDIKGKKLLPNLKLNIRCGNSLVSGDITLEKKDLFYEENSKLINSLIELKNNFHNSQDEKQDNISEKIFIEEDTLNRKSNQNISLFFKKIDNIKPLNYPVAFPEVFKDGGFDFVIGNPPYIKLHNIDKELLNYSFKFYETAEKKCDIYSFFVERVSKDLLKENGVLGFIISDTWLNLDSFKNLRKIVLKDNKLLEVVKLDNPFSNVSVSTVMFFLQKKNSSNYPINIVEYDHVNNKVLNEKKIKSSMIKEPDFIIDLSLSQETIDLSLKIEKQSHKLNEISYLQYGIMTADNDRFVLDEPKNKYCKPLLSGEDISRYKINWDNDRYIDYRPDEMKKKKTARPGEPERFEQDEKIIFQRYSSRNIIAALDTNKFYTLGTTIISKNLSDYSNYYILSILNSKLISWWYGRAYTSPTNYIREFEQIPIKKITTSEEKELYLKLIELSKEISLVISNNSIEKVKIRFMSLDKEINEIVYKLYDLTEIEINIVEESFNKF